MEKQMTPRRLKARKWTEIAGRMIDAVSAGDMPAFEAAFDRIQQRDASELEIPCADEAFEALLNWRTRVMSDAMRKAIWGRGPHAAGVCEKFLNVGLHPSWGWGAVLSEWKGSKNWDEVAQSQCLAEVFLRAGASVECEGSGAATLGRTESPLWTLCHYPSVSDDSEFEASRSVGLARFLLDRGANPDHLHYGGESPLAGCLNEKGAQFPRVAAALTSELLRAGANPALGPPGRSPLQKIQDPELKTRLNSGARDALQAWLQAGELEKHAPADRPSAPCRARL